MNVGARLAAPSGYAPPRAQKVCPHKSPTPRINLNAVDDSIANTPRRAHTRANKRYEKTSPRNFLFLGISRRLHREFIQASPCSTMKSPLITRRWRDGRGERTATRVALFFPLIVELSCQKKTLSNRAPTAFLCLVPFVREFIDEQPRARRFRRAAVFLIRHGTAPHELVAKQGGPWRAHARRRRGGRSRPSPCLGNWPRIIGSRTTANLMNFAVRASDSSALSSPRLSRVVMAPAMLTDGVRSGGLSMKRVAAFTRAAALTNIVRESSSSRSGLIRAGVARAATRRFKG